MAKFVKDILKPGVYRKGDKVIKVTSDDLRHWKANFDEMKARNYRVPVPWDHPASDDEMGHPVNAKDRERLRQREMSRMNAGWVESLSFDAEGTLQAELNIPREEDAAKLSEIGSYVSPQFGKWGEYTNCLSHIALTVKPVAKNQTSKFHPVEAPTQFSVLDLVSESVIQMSLADLEQMGDGCHPNQTQMDNSGSTQAPPAHNPHQPPGQNPNADPNAQEGMKDVMRLKHSLMAHGIDVRDETANDPDLLHALLMAATQHHDGKRDEKKEAMKTQGKPGERPMTPGQNETSTKDQPIEEEKTVVTMSEADQKQLSELLAERDEAKAELRKLAVLNERLLAEQTKTKRGDYVRRIDSLVQFSQCDAPTAQKLYEIAGTYQFSDHGDGFANLDIRLETLEANPKGTFLTTEQKIQQFSVVEEQKGAFFTGGNIEDSISDEDADKLAQAQLKILGKA